MPVQQLIFFLVLVALFVAFLVGVFRMRAPAEIARASVAGHIPGAGSLSRGGRAAQRDSDADSDDDKRARLLHLKRELLERWAKDGQTIDIVTEAKAELVAIEIEERSSAWRDYTAAATTEPTNVEGPFEPIDPEETLTP